jgi:MFS transporter, DHA1 family, multidrug resistance protein
MDLPSRPLDAAVTPPTAVSLALAALALALLLGLQPITTDIVLPALPMLARDLAASMGAVQLTMSALILSFGVAQLVWGPVADRVGRRPVLLAGLGLYTLASIGAAAAGSIEMLIVWRVLQGACMAAAVVVARAMLRDLYEPHEGAQVMSRALSGLGVIAILGPALGGLVASAAGWRGPLAVVALCGAATLAFVATRLPETLARNQARAGPRVALLAAWAVIGRHPTFLAWTLLFSFSYGGLFTMLAGSSFIYIDVLGLSPRTCGLAMASGSLAYLGATFVCRRWIPRFGMAGAVRRGAFFTLAGGATMAALALAGVTSVWAVLMPQWLYCFGHGILQPCGQAGAVGPFPHAAGAASALAGFVLALIAFGVGLWLGQVLAGGVRPFALGVGFWALLTCTVGWTLVQRSGR